MSEPVQAPFHIFCTFHIFRHHFTSFARPHVQVEALLEELQKEKAESKAAGKRAADAAATAASSIQRLEGNLQSREADVKANLESIDRCGA